MSWSLKQVFGVSAAAVITSALMTYSIGLSDENSAVEHLRVQNYKVLRYDGHAMLHKQHGEIYADKFRVEDSDGRKHEVVVTRDFDGDYTIRSINTLEKDMPVEKKQPYNPFKIPRAP